MPALLAGAKTVVRFPWSDAMARRYRADSLVVACDAGPRRGGRPPTLLQLVAPPRREPLTAMPDADYEADGWRWLHDHPEWLGGRITAADFSWEAFCRWCARPGLVYVLRFALVAVLTGDGASAMTPPLQQRETA